MQSNQIPVDTTNKISLQRRINSLILHPEFIKNPVAVFKRLLMWELFKLIQHKSIINIHKKSKMQLTPGKKRGVHGIIYIFRDECEPIVKYAINQYVRSGDICYDIGANIGLWTLALSEIVGDSGFVYSFEPMSDNIQKLKKNLAISSSLRNVEIIPFGLGTENTKATLYIPSDPGGTSLAPQSCRDKTEQITVKRLDDIWESQGNPKVSFVKIDVEGAEPLVLEGGSKFFQEVKPIICCEVKSQRLKLMGKGLRDVFEKLNKWGYQGFVYDENNGLKEYDYKSDGDIIFKIN